MKKSDLLLARSDRDLGFETSKHVSLTKLDLEGAHKYDASPYEPTPFGILEDMMLALDIDHRAFTFIDLGAGKGRILCLASAWPFRRIVGVELSKELSAAARHNVSQLSAAWRKCRKIEVVTGDAAEWDLPLSPLIFYLFNPFGSAVLAPVLDHIQASFMETPRDIYVLYYMPVHAELFARAPCLEPLTAAKDWSIWIASEKAAR